MSHAILQHAAEEMSHSRLIDITSIVLVGLVWAFLPSDMTALFTQYLAGQFLKFVFELPYSRGLEKEADEVGIMLAARACFDVRYSAAFWKRMNEAEGDIPEILSTHPASETRAIDLEELMPQVHYIYTYIYICIQNMLNLIYFDNRFRLFNFVKNATATICPSILNRRRKNQII